MTTAGFDIEEYFHLALHANSTGQPHACMAYLKEILRQQPQHAPATYLLAVQHAEIGMRERAIAGMKTALAIEPELEIARFQMGMLLADRGRRDEAKEAWSPLRSSDNPAMRSFAEGMIAVVDGNHQAARDALTEGLSHESGNPALSNLMQRILADIAKNDAESEAPAQGQDEPAYLGAYRQNS